MLETSLRVGLNFLKRPVPAERHNTSSDFLKVDTSFKKVFEAEHTQFKPPEILIFNFFHLEGWHMSDSTPALLDNLAVEVKYLVTS